MDEALLAGCRMIALASYEGYLTACSVILTLWSMLPVPV
jgi:hypothetical protein